MTGNREVRDGDDGMKMKRKREELCSSEEQV